jgi:hypothetical protein
VLHARDVGWRHLLNGALIAQAAARFDVLVTTDKNIRNEQNLDKLPISVLELNTRFTRIEDLRTLSPYLENALAACLEYRFVSVSPDGLLEKLGKFSSE